MQQGARSGPLREHGRRPGPACSGAGTGGSRATRADFAAITDGVHVPKWLETVRAAVTYVATRPNIDPKRIVLAGISLGAFLSLALAAELSSSQDPAERATLRAVLDISGGLVAPFDTLATPYFPPTLILHGADDTVVPVSHAHELDRKLTQLDVAHRTEILPGEGHWFSAASAPRMLLATSAFLQVHLQSRPTLTVAM